MEFKETETVAIPLINSQDGAHTSMSDKGPTILDSGDRTQFESGAVRDMREGKGRCDLLPLEVVANYVCDTDDGNDWIISTIREFQKDGCTCHLYSALLHFEQLNWSDRYSMILDVSKHFEAGAKKYGESNWQRGIPTYCYIDSALRHYFKWCRGDTDEPHARAFVWNLMCCIWEVDHRWTSNISPEPKED